MPQLGIAREHATTRIPTARAEQTVKEIREELSGGRFDYAGDVAVLADNTLVGLAPIERILAAEEDVPEETILRRLGHRLPWLFVGLAGAMAAPIIVGGFEEQLDKKVLLAFFLPAVVYMADAVGTQTETVLIRGLAVGIELRSVVLRELATGLVVGALMAAAFLPFALFVWGDGRVAVAVGLSLAASCSIATLVAMVFP